VTLYLPVDNKVGHHWLEL